MSDFDLSFSELPDLADRRLGAAVLAWSDEFFAPAENLIDPAPPRYDPDRYTDRGKWMDGWETRRRRIRRDGEGPDWCIVQLAAPARLGGVVVDTRHFRGNFPESCALFASSEPFGREPEALLASPWREIVPQSPLRGDTSNPFPVDAPLRVTHLRLDIHPDGGVARLRAHGEPIPDPGTLGRDDDSAVDVASVLLGGRVVDSSDAFFGSPGNLLLPGPSAGMWDGWETRRRRGEGNDWVVVRLAAESVLGEVEIDTSHFKGNAPGEISVETAHVDQGRVDQAHIDRGHPDAADFRPALPTTPVEPHSVVRLPLDEQRIATHVRLQIYPDGGVARLRVLGRVTETGRAAVGLARLDALPESDAERALADCCGSDRWVAGMLTARPFGNAETLFSEAERIWNSLEPDDWRQAFAAHPRIGQRDEIRRDAARAARWSSEEQAGAEEADGAVLVELAEANRRYEERFGQIFIVCASGKSAAEMLSILEKRLANPPDEELEIAAAEQAAITRLRLEKLLTS